MRPHLPTRGYCLGPVGPVVLDLVAEPGLENGTLATLVVVVERVRSTPVQRQLVGHLVEVDSHVPAVTAAVFRLDAVDLRQQRVGRVPARHRAAEGELDATVLIEEPKRVEEILPRRTIRDGPIPVDVDVSGHPTSSSTTLE